MPWTLVGAGLCTRECSTGLQLEVVVVGKAICAAPACGSYNESSLATAVPRSISTRSLSSIGSVGPAWPVPWAGRRAWKGPNWQNRIRNFALQRSLDCGLMGGGVVVCPTLTGTRTCRRCTCLNRRSRLRSLWMFLMKIASLGQQTDRYNKSHAIVWELHITSSNSNRLHCKIWGFIWEGRMGEFLRVFWGNIYLKLSSCNG